MDPVLTPNFKKVNLDKLKKLIVFKASRSYQWSFIPPFVPFIPFGEINPYKLDIEYSKIKILNFTGYGHSDLIDLPWRNIMHYSRISLGIEDRSDENIHNYHKNLVNEIINYATCYQENSIDL